MPASPSRNREPSQPTRKRLIWPIALSALLATVVVVLLALPASLITRFLPPQIHAEDFSGNIWHGSSARISFMARPAGALEWRLHPIPLLSMTVAASVRWVKGASVIDGEVALDRRGFDGRDIHGGGPLENLRDFGLPAGWSGNAKLDLREIKGTFDNLESAAGSIAVSDLAAANIAAGADLGGYILNLSPNAVTADSIVATIKDTGGPLEAQAEIRYTPAAHSGVVSGTVKERANASPALREQLTHLAQMRPRDNAGRIPVELEFAF